ncbi:hypothetical protein SAMN05421771_0179 [Granulicella pectinivorans]|jgi:hypothetical protein|uniref:Uncharacterized protein n=1 Tax=Granulicella pectinivorans TaxID=474950 RepID=A0A1I6L301_9BACT|nr:hypothetical protein [Granulicella pectinivorans]SFR97821.1 hypothetical protein SAMN05421771_0179 [Granulicella pectinivorans]
MFSLLALLPIVPYDSAIDTPLGHRNLVIIYVVVWVVQMGYGAYAIKKWRDSAKSR